MTSLTIVVLALALAASVFGLSRELRLRQALEKLLRLLLNHWKTHAANKGNHNQNSSLLDANDDLPGLR